MNTTRKVTGIIAGLTLAASMTACKAASAEPMGPTKADKKHEAVKVCKHKVAKQLKAPKSADFDKPHIKDLASDTWRIKGQLHATNGFGGVVPLHYTCKARWHEDKQKVTAHATAWDDSDW